MIENFLVSAIKTYLKETFFPFKGKEELLDKFKKEGYSFGKALPTERGVEAIYFYKEKTFAKYILAVFSKDKLYIAVNATAERQNFLIISEANFTLPKGYQAFEKISRKMISIYDLSRFLSPMHNSIYAYGFKDKNLEKTLDLYINRISLTKYNKERLFSLELRSLLEEENYSIDFIYENYEDFFLPLKSISKAPKLQGGSSTTRYMFSSLRKYMVVQIGEKIAFNSLSEKRKKQLLMTMTKNFWRKNFFISGVNNNNWDLLLGYVHTEYFIKELYKKRETLELRMKYSFKENELEDFLDEFYKVFFKYSKEFLKKEGSSFIKQMIKRYSLSNFSLTKRKLLKELNSINIEFTSEKDMKVIYHAYIEKIDSKRIPF